jgi:hypothetical protein
LRFKWTAELRVKGTDEISFRFTTEMHVLGTAE